ncbi:hypothetical protein, partial [Luteibacter sp.]|uniref:hypothetical protein n=1 Tax=Luteibacter sp. TaxID=1886636 RepID=UPI003F7CE3B1
MTPKELWDDLRLHQELPYAVVVFEDQLVSIDPSYMAVSVNGDVYMVSPIAAMLHMKFRPPFYVGRLKKGLVLQDIELRRVSVEDTFAKSIEGVSAFFSSLLETTIACQGDSAIEWYARRVFDLKRNGNHRRALLQQLKELEAIARLWLAKSPGEDSVASVARLIQESAKSMARNKYELRKNQG